MRRRTHLAAAAATATAMAGCTDGDGSDFEADDAADRFAQTVERLAERVDAGYLELVTPAEIESEYVFDAD